MQVLWLGVLLLLATNAAAWSGAEDYCDAVKNTARELSPQLPIVYDSTTTWVSLSAVYINGQCRIDHEYLLDSWALIDVVHEHLRTRRADVTREALIDFYGSEDGANEMRVIAEDKIRQRLPDMMEVPGVIFRAHYSTEGPIEPFTVEIITGTE